MERKRAYGGKNWAIFEQKTHPRKHNEKPNKCTTGPPLTTGHPPKTTHTKKKLVNCRDWTSDPLICNQMLYHWAKPTLKYDFCSSYSTITDYKPCWSIDWLIWPPSQWERRMAWLMKNGKNPHQTHPKVDNFDGQHAIPLITIWSRQPPEQPPYHGMLSINHIVTVLCHGGAKSHFPIFPFSPQ